MSSLQLPDDLSIASPSVYSESVLTQGLEVRDAIAGLGLLTRGLVWPAPQIWLGLDQISGISTSWSVGATVATTTWSNTSGPSSTTWTDEPKSGLWGEN
jgi:hypothetical protein